MKRSIALIIAMAVQLNAFATNNQQDNQLYQFFDFGVERPDYFSNVKTSWAPTIGMGVGYQLSLSESWELENELSIDYSTGNITRPYSNKKSYGTADYFGLWATTRLKRNDVFENISPFIELEAGFVNVDYKLDNYMTRENIAVIKANVGLQFSFENNMDMSISMGISDNSEINDF